MRLRCLSERIGLVDSNFHGTFADHVKQIICVCKQIGALRYVREQGRARDIERTFGAQSANIEIGDGTGRISERHEQAQRPQAIQRSWIGCLTDGIVDHVDAFATRDLFYSFNEVF